MAEDAKRLAELYPIREYAVPVTMTDGYGEDVDGLVSRRRMTIGALFSHGNWRFENRAANRFAWVLARLKAILRLPKDRMRKNV